MLDGCCGTGDLAVAARKAGAGEVIGLDFSARMLERARRKEPAIEWIQGDLLELPFEDGSFDAATVGFGVRNVADLERGLDELRRVLKPGGRVGILEITRPSGPLKLFYRLWFDVLIPLAGKILPGGKAYTYLPASVRRFPGPDRAGRADARARLRRRRLSPPRRRDRRAPHGNGGVTTLEAVVALPGVDEYMAQVEERLDRRCRVARRPRRRGGRGRARGGRQAAAAVARVPLRSRRARTLRSRPAPQSSSFTWRRSSTTT